MPLYNANVLIKELRTAQGMTQAKLAEGICSRETISRIESGERKADWFILQNALARLGVKLDNIQNHVSEMLSEDEAYVIKKNDECKQYFASFNIDALKNTLDELAGDKRFAKSSAGRGYQVYLRYLAALHVQGQYKNPKYCLECAVECIKLNRPDFDMDKIPEYLISQDELMLLNLIAVASIDIESIHKAIDIWLMLKSNYEKQYNVVVHENPRYRELVLNICSALKNAERYEECLAIAEEGLKSALAHDEMRTHLIYFRQKVWCLMKLGKEEGKEQYKKFLMLAYVMDGYSSTDFAMGKREYEENFGGKLDLSVDW